MEHAKITVEYGWGHSVAQKTCKTGPRLLWRTNRKSHTRFWLVPKSTTLDGLERRIQGLPKVFKYLLISQADIPVPGKATDFSFGRYIHRVHLNKSPLKILKKRERGRIQWLPDVFKYPLLSQERVKLRSYELQILYPLWYHRLQQRPINDFGKSSLGRSQGLQKIFGASVYRTHRAVIFAIARLSCWTVLLFIANMHHRIQNIAD